MISRISTFAIFCFLLVSCKDVKEKPGITEKDYVSREHLIEVSELLDIYTEENIKIIDFRDPLKYQKGHIGGSLNIWRTALTDSEFPYTGMKSDKESIELLFGSLGITNDDLIVIYDDKGSPDAARLWCLLDNYDYNDVKILHGGLMSWLSAGGKLTTALYSPAPTEFNLPVKSEKKLWIGKNELLGLLNNKKNSIIIIDTRTQEEYSGYTIKNGASKGGRIPTSIHIDWAEAVDLKDSNKFRSMKELQNIYKGLEIETKDAVIVYCHTGYRSSLTTFVLRELMGFENVRNYDGSWVEWSYFNELPYEKDSII